ncbi:hypothetical protein [Lysobacter sp. CA196]|uniref:hypothetical protein n=1 Tax=Lysobacter sp. CA196 TaxID=3455606 RepID=UPI003F8D7DA6
MLRLPALPTALVREVIVPALARFPASWSTRDAIVLLVAIAIQETQLATRRQGTPLKPGPARGLWQFEVAGASGVLQHPETHAQAQALCRQAGIHASAGAVHRRVEVDDLFACQFARLLLRTDPSPLPYAHLSAEAAAFAYYLRNWRPGAARTAKGRAKCAKRFTEAWRLALEAVA